MRAAHFLLIVSMTLVLCPALSAEAQTPTQTYLRKTQSDIEREDPRVNSIIARAEEHFKLGKINQSEKNWHAARMEFDKAVDSVLESGMDVRSNPRLLRYYNELVERVYREEIPLRAPAPGTRQSSQSLVRVTQGEYQKSPPPTVGFAEQKFEPSPLDELSKIELTKEDLIKPPPESTKRACASVKVADLELRGFRLGMSQAEVQTRIPDLAMKRISEFGESKSFNLVRVNRFLSRNATLKGVVSVGLWYLDGRVTTVAMSYDDSIKWDSADEFVEQVAASLRLPSEWERFRSGGYADELRA